MTPLMYAARKGYPHVVALLVAHGAHINAQDGNGYSVSDLLLCVVINNKNIKKQEPTNLFLSTAFSEILIGIFCFNTALRFFCISYLCLQILLCENFDGYSID